MASSELKGRGWAYLQTGAAAAALQLAVGLDSVNVHMPSGPQLAASRCSPARDSKFDSLPALSSLLPTANLPLIASQIGKADGREKGESQGGGARRYRGRYGKLRRSGSRGTGAVPRPGRGGKAAERAGEALSEDSGRRDG